MKGFCCNLKVLHLLLRTAKVLEHTFDSSVDTSLELHFSFTLTQRT